MFAFVHAVRAMHRALCGGRPGLCEHMRPPSGPLLLRYLRRVRFTGTLSLTRSVVLIELRLIR